jgi:thiamine transport system ATP-binding protein
MTEIRRGLTVEGLTVEGLTVAYGETIAVADLDLELTTGGRLALMGPSGCGKTSVLRALAGLEPTRQGSIQWDDQRIDTLAPHRRRFGLMFQDYALFPHLNVAENVGFGLGTAGWAQSAISVRVGEALELVDLVGFEHRQIGSLSGGEQQRVALARTLAPQPRLLMLDEPIGSLDRPLRERLLVDMQAIFDRIEATVLYVTHDRDEAFAIADQVAVMSAGRIVGEGRPGELWENPRSAFVADFLGIPNLYRATAGDGFVDAGWLRIPTADPGRVSAIAVPHEAIRLTEDAGAYQGTTLRSRFSAGHYLVDVDVADGVVVELASDRLPSAGGRLRFVVDPERVLLLDG